MKRQPRFDSKSMNRQSDFLLVSSEIKYLYQTCGNGKKPVYDRFYEPKTGFQNMQSNRTLVKI